MMIRTSAVFLAFLLLLPATGGCAALPISVGLPGGAPQSAPAPDLPPDAAPDPSIIAALNDLVETKDRFFVDLTQAAPGTPLGDMLKLGSPVGYRLRNRYLGLGIPLSEALSRNSDPSFQEKLVTRWDGAPEIRADALVTLAGIPRDLSQFAIYREALMHLDPGVRFGAIEGLGNWGKREQAAPLLTGSADRDSEPILRVQAAAELARLGDPSGLDRLRGFLDNPSWLVKAMAARYLGDLGTGADYDLMVTRLPRETANDFVTAEICIAAIKLFPKKPQ